MINYESSQKSQFNDWQEIDLIVSRDCTIRCTYCYLHKNKEKFYDLDAIIDSLDKQLTVAEENDKEGVVIGLYPEPWVNIKRTNELIVKALNVLLKHPRYVSNFMIMLGTNGVFLERPIPILENDFLMSHLSVNVTVDGVKEQHDMYRVFEDGSPTWDKVVANVNKFRDKYHINGTKVTLGPDTLKFAYQSTVYLWDELGLDDVNMNVVFEDLWGDEENLDKLLVIYEEQLNLLFEDIVKNKRWETNKYSSLIGSRNVPFNYSSDKSLEKKSSFVNASYCGAGVMRSIDTDGSVYPCFRLSPYSLKDDKTFKIGETESSRALKLLNNFDAVDEECYNCEILSTCSMCIGGAYDESKSLFYRSKHHCKFQKLQYKYSKKLFNYINGNEDEE